MAQRRRRLQEREGPPAVTRVAHVDGVLRIGRRRLAWHAALACGLGFPAQALAETLAPPAAIACRAAVCTSRGAAKNGEDGLPSGPQIAPIRAATTSSPDDAAASATTSAIFLPAGIACGLATGNGASSRRTGSVTPAYTPIVLATTTRPAPHSRAARSTANSPAALADSSSSGADAPIPAAARCTMPVTR
ncbi:hypothetical protein GCM10027612_49560 [Microbispora bryophytorum subsp. camponoti]